jgi:predicted transcriptional regulator
LGTYRSRLDIIADILVVASERSKKTRIMYQANLSYRLLCKYLPEVLKAYLVRFERKERCYVLTRKGKDFLERYKEYSKESKNIETHLNETDARRKELEELCSKH